MRFSLLNAELLGLAGSAHQWAVRNDQGAVRISDILRRSFRATANGQFHNRISLRNSSIFGQPTGGTPPATRKAKLKRCVQRAPINARLPARNYLKRGRLD
jgi:hypothetical protein